MRVFDKVSEILIELGGSKVITPESKLQEDLMFDSLQMVMLLLELEDKFNIIFDEADMNPFDLMTVGDVVLLVGKYCGDGDEEDS